MFHMHLEDWESHIILLPEAEIVVAKTYSFQFIFVLLDLLM